MSDDQRYNGWTNYETWAVKLWMDNEEGFYRAWQDRTQDAWDQAEDKSPNQFMDKSSNARCLLAGWLLADYDEQSDHPVFDAANHPSYRAMAERFAVPEWPALQYPEEGR